MSAPAVLAVPDSPRSKVQTLYRYFDGDGQLLYVGITANGIKARWPCHQKSEWWPLRDPARDTVELFLTREEVEFREAVAIATEKPAYNKVIPTTERVADLAVRIPTGDDVATFLRTEWLRSESELRVATKRIAFLEKKLLSTSGVRWERRHKRAANALISILASDPAPSPPDAWQLDAWVRDCAETLREVRPGPSAARFLWSAIYRVLRYQGWHGDLYIEAANAVSRFAASGVWSELNAFHDYLRAHEYFQVDSAQELGEPPSFETRLRHRAKAHTNN